MISLQLKKKDSTNSNARNVATRRSDKLKIIHADGVKIEMDGQYYRVSITLGTHKFHSEKLNLDTAVDLHYQLLTGSKI